MCQPKSVRIVVCDEDPREAIFFQVAVTNIGVNCDITFLRSGLELLRFLSRAKTIPDLVFLDINFNGVSGLEILAIIRKYEQWRRLPVIIHCTSNSVASIDTAYLLGASRYWVKTWSVPNFERTLKALMVPESAGAVSNLTTGFRLEEMADEAGVS